MPLSIQLGLCGPLLRESEQRPFLCTGKLRSSRYSQQKSPRSLDRGHVGPHGLEPWTP